MKTILIDGSAYEKPRGLGRYLRELLFSLGEHPPEGLRFVVAIPRNVSMAARITAPNIRYLDCPSLPFPLWEQILIPWIARKERVDLLHCPANTKPLVLNLWSLRHLVTLHDLTFLHESGTGWYQNLGAVYRRVVVTRMFRGRIKVLTDSLASKLDIEQTFAVVPMVAPISVSSFLGCADKSNINEKSDTSYFIHIGGISPHKNTERLIRAFLAADLADWRLVVVGLPVDSAFAKSLKSPQVQFPGWLSDVTLLRLVRGAEAMVFPSLREGYGLPIIEAFELGVPLLTSARAPMSELAGNAALLVDPESETEITVALQRLATDPQLRQSLASAGRERVREFSSQAMSSETAQAYRAALV